MVNPIVVENVPVGQDGGTADAVTSPIVEPLVRLQEAVERALDACHRLEKIYEAVHEDDSLTGFWLLDVIRGLASDGKPPLRDPESVWESVAKLIIACGRPTVPLPDLQTFAGATPTPTELRRKPVASAVKAALFAPGYLLADLMEQCVETDTVASDPETLARPSAELFSWDKVQTLLGRPSGDFFSMLAGEIRAELERALGTASRIQQQAVAPPTSVEGAATVREDGPEPNSRNFWFRGQRCVMPRGNVTAILIYLWPRPNRQANADDVIEEVWTRHRRDVCENSLPSLRRHCNAFFEAHSLPFSLAIETHAEKVVLIKPRPER